MAKPIPNPRTEPSTDPAATADRTLRFLERLFPAPRRVAVRLWNGAELPVSDGAARATIVLRTPETLAQMLTPPVDLSAGEAYLRGDVEIEGDIEAVVEEFESQDWGRVLRDRPRLALDVVALRRSAAAPKSISAQLRGRQHSRARDRQAIAHHYDVSNDFYQLWLDERMVYSCGYFPLGDESLGAAQEAKLDLICRKLRLRPGERLLDIGCGWGGLVIFAAERYGVTAVGVTLSTEQLEEAGRRVAAAGLGDRVRIELLDYRDVRGEFDKVASVGMAEHVGREKLAAYFHAAFERLVPGGAMLNHAISRGPRPSAAHDEAGTGEFIRRYVFPDGEILPLWETLQAAESVGLEVRDVEDLREHYATTLRHWVRNLEERWEAAVAEVGSERARVWRLFMSASAHQFDAGRLAVHQVLLAKPDTGGRVTLPRSRADVYASGGVPGTAASR